MSDLKTKTANPLESFKRNDVLYNKYRKKLDDSRESGFVAAKLTEIRDINLFQEDEANILASIYHDEDSDIVRFGSVMNSSISEGKIVFQLTVAGVNDLATKDPHHDLRACDGEYYRKMIAKAIAKKWIVQLRPAVTGKKGKRKGAIYEIVDRDFLEPLLRRKAVVQHLAEKDYILNWYDKTDEKVIPLTPEQEAYAAEMSRRAQEKMKARNET